MGRSRSAPDPVVDPQPRDAGELAGIVGDEGQIARLRLTGDQHIIGADRRTSTPEIGPDLAGNPRVLPVQIKDGQVHEEKPEGFEVERDPLASIGPVPEFVGNHGRDGERTGRHGVDPVQQYRRSSRHQRDDRVGVEQPCAHWNA